MLHVSVMYGIATLSLAFGLVALLKQKTYIDPETHCPTEVEVPLLGKLRTNYPALVFVVLGVVLAHTTFNKAYPAPEVEWMITGEFKLPEEGQEIDWRDGHFSSFPVAFEAKVAKNGSFRIRAKVEEGRSLEEFFQGLAYDHPAASTWIDLKGERENFTKGEESLIEATTETTWDFKPIPVKWFSGK